MRLPPPRPAAVTIGVTVLEVRAGLRPPSHLTRLSHHSLWPLWDTFADPAARDPTATTARPLAVALQEHAPGLVDATVVLRLGGRVEPLALLLDGAQGHWELMELEYPSSTGPDLPARILGRSRPPTSRGHDILLPQGSPHRRPEIPRRPARGAPPPAPAWDLDPLDSPGIDLA